MDTEKLKKGDKAELAKALALLESDPYGDATIAFLTDMFENPRAHVIGVTGPPGVGKSTLLGKLIAKLRAANRTVGVIAVDPSSKRTGGALLGDRIRLETDPEDSGVFVRSMAARDRLGGLAEITIAAMVVMRAVYDVVLVETVGVGQSETDVEGAADTVVFCVQPGSGDSLQFMKAGIVEIPDIVVVTKADMEAAARQARIDIKGAIKLTGPVPSSAALEGWETKVLSVSATEDRGIGDFVDALDSHRDWLRAEGRLDRRRHKQAEGWLIDSLRERFGREGLKRAGNPTLQANESPFRKLAEIAGKLGGDVHE
ncbi:MAG: methylmalonyl Co-A mutase-associated GTPase MeaB [Alphaproteobacteria bacterium]